MFLNLRPSSFESLLCVVVVVHILRWSKHQRTKREKKYNYLVEFYPPSPTLSTLFKYDMFNIW